MKRKPRRSAKSTVAEERKKAPRKASDPSPTERRMTSARMDIAGLAAQMASLQ